MNIDWKDRFIAAAAALVLAGVSTWTSLASFQSDALLGYAAASPVSATIASNFTDAEGFDA